jgi:pimeloyl-ACP methyl ester carboxylesterase
MRRKDRQAQLKEKTNQLLRGPLKHARAAALALSLVPLASVAAAAAQSNPCEWFSGGFGVSLVDPVPDLLDGDGLRITTNTGPLSDWSKGRWVMGVGADGVTQVVLRISGNFIYGLNGVEQLTVTVLNDETTPSQSVDEDGGLGAVGAQCPGADCEHHQVTVTTSCIDYQPQAFVVYRAPIDFSRTSVDDSGLAGRDVYIRIESVNGSMDLPVRILRPPLALIHGLWDNAGAWSNFSPLMTNGIADWRFSALRVNYGETPVSVTQSSPPLTLQGLGVVKANSLGFMFNRDIARDQMVPLLEGFRTGTNPEYIPVAGVQADVVAHSMGGNIARAMALHPQFLNRNTFHQGIIHKLITIDTPHLGSAVATRFLMPDEYDRCLQHSFGNLGKAVLSTAVVNGVTVSGALGDLVDSPMSPALQQLATQNPHPLPTAMLVGVYTNFGVLDSLSNVNALALKHWPTGCPDDPLVLQLTSTGWPAIFNEQNDGIVGRSSQENGSDQSAGLADGYVHSPGTKELGFDGPSVLEPPVPAWVIDMLNKPVTNQQYYKKINP